MVFGTQIGERKEKEQYLAQMSICRARVELADDGTCFDGKTGWMS